MGVDIGAYVVVFSVQLVFSGYQVWAKYVFADEHADPIAFIFMRSMASAVLLLTIAACRGQAPWSPIGPLREHKKTLVLLGFAMACDMLGIIFALRFATSRSVAVFQVIRPIVAGFLSRAFGTEEITKIMWAGISISVWGVLMIILSEPIQNCSLLDRLIGFGFVLIHAIGQSYFVVMQPGLLKLGCSPIAITGYSYAAMSLIIAVMLPLPIHGGVSWHASTKGFWDLLIYSSLCVGAYSYVAMGWAAKSLGGTAVMLFMLLQSILTVCSGSMILHEPFGSIRLFCAGSVCILAGIGIYIGGRTRRQVRHVLDKDEEEPLLYKC